MKLSEKEQHIARAIDTFYLEIELKSKQDTSKDFDSFYDKCSLDAVKTVKDLSIKRIQLNKKDNTIEIYSSKPGYIIGKAGENINKLQKYINEKLKTEYELVIKEDNLDYYLLPYIYTEDNWEI